MRLKQLWIIFLMVLGLLKFTKMLSSVSNLIFYDVKIPDDINLI